MVYSKLIKDTKSKASIIVKGYRSQKGDFIASMSKNNFSVKYISIEQRIEINLSFMISIKEH